MTTLATTSPPSYAEDVPSFAECVRRHREAQGLTLAEAGERAGMTRQTWHQYESGRRANPTLAVMRAMALALEVSLQDLVANVDTEPEAD